MLKKPNKFTKVAVILGLFNVAALFFSMWGTCSPGRFSGYCVGAWFLSYPAVAVALALDWYLRRGNDEKEETEAHGA
jgi:hypothetical protein